MATDAEQLATIKSQALAILAEITASPKPTYTVDGQMVSWGDYHAQQTALVNWCNTQLAVETPFETHVRGYT